MANFTGLDWFWAGAFLLLMVGGAFFFYRLARRSESDFFLAGRGLPWWLPASSVFSTHTATDTPMWVTGVIYAHGLRGLWYTFFAAWTAIASFVSARVFRRSLAYTQAEWQELRFGGLGAELLRGWLAGWQVFMNMFILGWVGIAMGKVGQLAFGWPVWVGLVVPTLITAVYTLAAGYWGVVMGDFLQGIVAVFAIVLVSLVGVFAVGGPAAVSLRLVEIGEAWRLDPLAFTGWLTGNFPAAWWLTMLIIAVVGGFGMGTSIDWYVEAQRIQSARSVRDASYGLWAGGAVTLIRNSIWAAGILAFFLLVPNLTSAAEYELGWFRLGFELLPVGMIGVFFGAILAIHLSTISSHLNLGALYFTRDLFQRYLRPDADERTLVWVGRITTFVLLIGSFFYGLMMEEITQWLIFALWLMMAGIWLPNILQVVWWRFNAWGYLSSWIANLGISWLVVWVLPAFGVFPPLPEYVQFWFLMALGALVFLPATLLTRAEPMDHLVQYYVMTRPIGWWAPVRREAQRRGLLVQTEAPSPAEQRRPLIRRSWTPEQADEWTREDWIAIVLSPIVFALLMVGVTKLLLLQLAGGVLTLGAIVGALLIYWVIDPKLRAVSHEYEVKQARYLEELERRLRSEGPTRRGGSERAQGEDI
ncbi:MAG: sodium:solute symporter [Gemmatimonadales bacterium]|nr:sodium:solute symporter [Gemmatimonadales bacterium]NIN12984.1 sodium:solute symporter [Gemmatimonadales bacterium]NIN51061.1 sodium:solute symporter [Gemmatimonadales bacterium]NIP08525.1 sodium:solute symporter [Gemmatimonadales bacterium]NIR02243.1 sodium:solute symporter [Gemmatimonadales bacterium]